MSTRISAGDVVRLRVYCGGDQWNLIAVNDEVADAVNCRGGRDAAIETLRPSRLKESVFQNSPPFALLLSTRRRRSARRQSTAAAMESDHRFRGGRSRLSPKFVRWLLNNQNQLTFFVFWFFSTGVRPAALGDSRWQSTRTQRGSLPANHRATSGTLPAAAPAPALPLWRPFPLKTERALGRPLPRRGSCAWRRAEGGPR